MDQLSTERGEKLSETTVKGKSRPVIKKMLQKEKGSFDEGSRS